MLFVLLLWNFGFHPLRPALPAAAFSGFFDDQAKSLLHGHLYLEPGAAGIEAFIVNGREYLYFPPGLAILRLPLVLFTDRFQGRLTAPSMLVGWAVLVTMCSRLLWAVRRQFRPDGALGRWELGLWTALHFSITAGSVVLYLAAMPWVYHEVYIWSIALTLAAMVLLIRIQESPSVRRVVGLGAVVLAVMMIRTTAGWALAGATIGYGVLAALRRRGTALGRLALPILAAGLVPLGLGIAVNWAKFQHPYLFPLEKQVFTGLNQHRRDALAANGGDLVSADILPTTLVNYFRPDGIRFTSVFPYVSVPADPAPTFGSSVIDQSYRTGSVVAFMPLLFGLSLWGAVALVRRTTRAATAALRLPVLAALAAGGPVVFYGYLAHRYTSEFVPALAIGAAVGMGDLIRRWAGRSLRFRRTVLGGAVALAVFGSYANFAAGYAILSVSNPGPTLERYLKVQRGLGDLTGHSFDHLVVRATDLPRRSVTDQVRIIGDCEASFVGTGDTYGPWEVLSMGEWTFTVTPLSSAASPTTVLLATVGEGQFRSTISAETEPGRFRTVTVRPDETFVGEWYPYQPGGSFQVEVLSSTQYRVFSIEPAPVDHKVVVPIITFDGEMNFPRFVEPVTDANPDVRVDAARRPASTVCTDLLSRARTAP